MRLFSLLGLARHERRNALLLIGNNFFEGLAIALFYSVALNYFLDYNPIYRYGWLMVASALSVLGFTLIFERFEHHLPPGKVFRILAASSVVSFAVGLIASFLGATINQAVIGFALMVLYHLIYFLYKMRFWGASAMFYDVRQSKRLFGMLGSVYLPAKFIGFTLVTTLDAFANIDYRILLSAAIVCYLISMLFMRVVNRENLALLNKHHVSSKYTKSQSKPIVRGIARLSAVVVFTLSFIAFLFAKEVQHHFEVEDGNMFRLISEALAISYGIAAIIKITITGRMLTRFKLKNLLIITPMVLSLSILVHWFIRTTSDIHAQEYLFFVMLMMVSLVLSETIDQPLTLSLFQPLGKKEILSAHTKVKGYYESIGVLILGFILLGLYNGHKHVDLKLAIPLVFVASVIWIWAGRRFSMGYLNQLRNLIDLKLISGERAIFWDDSLVQKVRDRLKSNEAADIIHAINLMEEAGHLKDEDILNFLEDERPEVLSELFRILNQRPTHSVEIMQGVQRSFESNQTVGSHHSVRHKAIQLTSRLRQEMDWESLNEMDYGTRMATLRGLANNHRMLDKRELVRWIQNHSTTISGVELVELMDFVNEFHHPEIIPVIRLGIEHYDPDVKRSALLAAKWHIDYLWADVMTYVTHPLYGRLAVQAFENMSFQLLTRLYDQGFISQDAFVKLLINREDRKSEETLLNLLESSGAEDRGKLLHQLCSRDQLRLTFDRTERMLRNEQDILNRLNFDIAEDGELKKAINLERNIVIERLLGLAFLHTGETVLRMAQTELFLYGENKMALCMEALQAALPMRLYGPIRKILESNTEYEVVSVPEAIALLESHQNHWTRWLQLVLHAEASKRNLAIEPMEQQTKTSGGTQHIDRVFLLRQTEMFESIRDNRLLDIAELMDEIEVDAGEFVFRKGDEGDSLYVITSGEISILDGGHELVRFSKGDFFGDLSLLDPAPRSADAKSVGKTTLLRLDEAAIYELMTGHIEVVKGILSALCKRIRNQNKLYVEAKNAM
ncbi:MAG: cyclic nucleotide-binding domain-containing protein [Flavobacteriales bacterium]|nr:cyclic nucleotide-binding domain-containing protein [Bacteroidota bacterium]MCB9241599.1 cyclic nucleotide-binding domain-containing protein [Flavobacteriales bacterium]